MKMLVASAALALALAGCGGKPKPGTAEAEAAIGGKLAGASAAGSKDLSGDFKVDASNQGTLMPHTVGSRWTYTMEVSRSQRGQATATARTEIVYQVAAVTKDGAQTRFQLATLQKGKKIDEQTWYVDNTGFYQASLGTASKPFTPPQPIIPFPVKTEGTFTWSGTSPNAATSARNQGKLEGKVIGLQPVDTEMGTMKALFVESVSLFDLPKGQKGQVITDAFFRPGIGIVRYEQTSRTANGQSMITLRLKDYTIK